jgi:hypothetical protein
MADQNTITFLAPSNLLYASPEGEEESDATAIFTIYSTHPPTKIKLPLGSNKFVPVPVGGGLPGGPTLTEIDVHRGELIFPLFPTSSLTVGPDSYAILQPTDSPLVFELSVFFDGKDQIVKFEAEA